ncbi:unnamed protein product [Didymodactylos carnosus]|uniref:Uncharacterized protein n=1 Tax=Didymodactylos carnosus TaxID=1234261 RepID=A0A8S2XY80_9BILA|nr:unnamed protein product [Didymodactylos carnosus]
MTDFFERYAKDGKNVPTSDWAFGHGRVSNATVETYFRTVKSSVLGQKINLRPTDFLMQTYSHTLSRMKGDKFGVAQSSRGRKKALSKADDLNAKETWRRCVQSKTKNGRRGYYFSDEVSQTNACKLSKGKMDEQRITINDSSIPAKKLHSPVNTSTDVRDVQSDSSTDDIAGHSFGFAAMPSNMLKTMDENIVDSKIVLPSSPFVNRDAASTKSSDASENIFSALLTATDASDLDNVYNNNDAGRNDRRSIKKFKRY